MDELEPHQRVELATDAAGNAIVRISGDLDISGIDSVQAQVAPVLAEHPAKLIVDASGLRFADSSAIALWVRWATTARSFELRNPSPLLRRVVTAMGLAEKLAVTP
ncbi:MAG TPA: STAS domain-containing protein [Solirubrobacteraceae bacterium]|nr:STAS domain-containing protein [Solirubrobacteraceae bacterium]